MSHKHEHDALPESRLKQQAEMMAAGHELQQKFQTLKENKDKAVISSPAELQFWQAIADKAPALLREQSSQALAISQNGMRPFAVGGVVVGALLGLVNFSKSLSRGVKIAASVGGVAAAAGGILVHSTQHGYANKMDAAVKQVADALEKIRSCALSWCACPSSQLTFSSGVLKLSGRACRTALASLARLRISSRRQPA